MCVLIKCRKEKFLKGKNFEISKRSIIFFFEIAEGEKKFRRGQEISERSEGIFYIKCGYEMEWPRPRWVVGFILEYRHRKETTQKPDFLAFPMVFHQNADAVGLARQCTFERHSP
jgi:hypothetical protein